MRQPYAVVLGEALVDLLEAGPDTYRAAVGGAPLNVAVGVARLGGAVEFVGTLGADVLGGRIAGFLRAAGVGDGAVRRVDAPTTLAVTTFDGTEPDFHFYGQPPSYGLLSPSDVDADLVAGADVLYCGSIALLCEPALAAARSAWAAATATGTGAPDRPVNRPLRTFDPNVRPRLLTDPVRYRAVVEEFAGTADLVKLSAADAAALYDEPVEAVAGRLADSGGAAVVLTLGAAGALVRTAGVTGRVAAPVVAAVDATGAGDATMAGLIRGLLDGGRPHDARAWRELVGFALAVAGLACEAPGGATAMPALADVRSRFPDRVPEWLGRPEAEPAP
jgi:fructokinase